MRLKCKLDAVYLEIVLILMQDWCMVCAECTIGLEIVLDAPDGTPRRRGSSGCSFLVRLEILLIFTQDRCTVSTKHTIGSKNGLDTTDGTPR